MQVYTYFLVKYNNKDNVQHFKKHITTEVQVYNGALKVK